VTSIGGSDEKREPIASWFLFFLNYDVHVLFMLLTIGKASKLKIKKEEKNLLKSCFSLIK
jgi:hypothetical protein